MIFKVYPFFLYVLSANGLLLPSSTVKAAHSTVVSKIDNRLEQYTSAAQVSIGSTAKMQNLCHVKRLAKPFWDYTIPLCQTSAI